VFLHWNGRFEFHGAKRDQRLAALHLGPLDLDRLLPFATVREEEHQPVPEPGESRALHLAVLRKIGQRAQPQRVAFAVVRAPEDPPALLVAAAFQQQEGRRATGAFGLFRDADAGLQVERLRPVVLDLERMSKVAIELPRSQHQAGAGGSRRLGVMDG
jgi:hypothetical protein